jgi:ABC-type uncharacterized transport system YnjBCD ATPase subunit
VRTPIEERSIGWVPQDAALFPHLDVAGNLRFGLARAGRDGERSLARAIEVFELGDDAGALALCGASFALALVAMLVGETWLRRRSAGPSRS